MTPADATEYEDSAMPYHYYVATFDLEQSKGREAEYGKVRQALECLVGSKNYYRPVKQCCIVRTNLNADTLRDSMTQTLGPRCNILIARLRFGFAFRIRNPETKRETGMWMRGIPRC
jgi:hypothetical protein